MRETSVPIVDCRSGKRVRVGEWVRYPPDMAAANPNEDDWKLLGVLRVGLFSATVSIGRAFDPVRDGHKLLVRLPGPEPANPIVVSKVECPVRWFHRAGNGAWRVILVPT